mmetsp:Transcript_53966/g.114645  ORF Transcript_53966/g.114645 Transcript_53966/m.114645 type:complete len:220 (-) Transcript_53966:443-1102(-)
MFFLLDRRLATQLPNCMSAAYFCATLTWPCSRWYFRRRSYISSKLLPFLFSFRVALASGSFFTMAASLLSGSPSASSRNGSAVEAPPLAASASMLGRAFLTTLNVASMHSVNFVNAAALTPAMLLAVLLCLPSSCRCSPAATSCAASELRSHLRYLYISMWSSSLSSLGRCAVGTIFFFFRPREECVYALPSIFTVFEREATALGRPGVPLTAWESALQ